MIEDEINLLHGYLNGTLGETDFAHLQSLLRENADARRMLRDLSTVDAKLQELAAINPSSLRLLTKAVTGPAQASLHPAWRGWFSWRPLMTAAAVVLVGSVFLLVVKQREATGAILRMESASGHVSIIRKDRAELAALSTPLREHDLVVVEKDGLSATLLLDRGATRLTLQPGARLRLLSMAPQKVLRLDEGSLNAEVAKQPPDAPLLIQTPHAEARVLGTAFSLTALQDQTGLTVAHGLVRISQPDGSAEDVATGQSAVAAKGRPVRLVPAPAFVVPVSERLATDWIKGPVAWRADDTIHFDFAKDAQDWVLTKGTRWEEPGVLRLHQQTRGTGGKYKAVAPAIPVTGKQRISITGKARVENGARLEINYYQHDAEHRCFGFARVPGSFTAGQQAGWTTFRFEFDTIASDELRYIAPILYCFHSDRTDPHPGDVIVIDEITFSRR